MKNKEIEEIIQKKADFIVGLTGFGTALHLNDILPDLKEIADVAYELGKKEYYSAVDVHKLIDELEPPTGEVKSNELISGKLFGEVAVKALEAPFPEVAVQHLIKRIYEKAIKRGQDIGVRQVIILIKNGFGIEEK